MKISVGLICNDQMNNCIDNANHQTVLCELMDKNLLDSGRELLFRHEPWDANDKNAIAVFGPDGRRIGFLPADVSAKVCEKLGNGIRVRICIEEITREDSKIGVKVSVEA